MTKRYYNPADHQQQAVYNWERETLHPKFKTGLPKEAITLVLAKVEALTEVEIVWRIDPRSTRWAWGGKEITLPNVKSAWAYSIPVAIHEATHVVLKAKGLCDYHGPKFVGAYLQLLKYAGGPVGASIASVVAVNAIERGIQVARMDKIIKTSALVEHNVPAEGFYHQLAGE